jgi:hypothetical protein
MSTAASSSAVFGGKSGLAPNMGFQSLTGASATGFINASVTNKIITLNFAGSIPVMCSASRSWSTSTTPTVRSRPRSFAGSTLKVVFGGLATLTGAFQPVLYDTIAKAEVYGSYTTRVPEPGSFVLVAMSLLALVWLGRKRVPAGFAK